MKRIFTLLVMVAMATCWIGCSDDDDNTPKRKLVSKIVNDGNQGELRFIYNEDAKITTIINEENYDINYIDSIVLERSGNKLLVRSFAFEKGILLNPDGELELTCTLDEQDRVTECFQEYNKEWIYFTYSDAGELLKVSYGSDWTIEYEWAQGNIVSMTENIGSGMSTQLQFFPSEVENNTNLDLNLILFNNYGLDFGWHYWAKALSEYLGIRCKNFIDSEESKEAWKWKHDANGNLIEICNYAQDKDPDRIIYTEQ